MYGFNNPGTRYFDPRQALAQRLLQEGASTAPVDHWMQGLGRLGQALAGNVVRGRVQGEQDAANKAFFEGMTGGGVDAAIQGLEGLEGNPYAGRMTQALLMQQAEQQAEVEAEARKHERAAQAREGTVEKVGDYYFQYQNGQPVPRPDLTDESFNRDLQLRAAGKPETNINMPGAGGRPMSLLDEEIDKKAAPELVEWAMTGAADYKYLRGQLNSALAEIEEVITTGEGNISGPILGAMPDAMTAIFNPQAVAVRERVETVVQRNLRTVLGAQFTENEGNRLISRAFNPRLDEPENAARLKALLRSMDDIAAAKNTAWKYVQENGTMQGFRNEGMLGMVSDPIGYIDRAMDAAAPATKAKKSGEAPQGKPANTWGIERLD